MRTRYIGCLVLTMLLAASGAEARKAVLAPVKSAAIVSPTDARDSRVLLYFELPADVMDSRARVDFATLVCTARVEGAEMGEIDAFPVTAEWKDEAVVSWSGGWEKPGGDYDARFLSNIYSLKSELGEKEIVIDVTEIVQGWRSGEIANNGILLKLNADDLENFEELSYTFDKDEVALRVFYSYEYH
jgi:hypothetical protein